jgi:NAD(P)-dependent dehydrogenase (short-subunit alcohol dehydrogenase family)
MSPTATITEAIQGSSLAGKSVIVIGASRGIGAECAVSCARAGAHQVMLVARTRPALYKVAREVRRHHATALVEQCDVTAPGVADLLVARMQRVDVLVNCAGANQPEPFRDVTEATFDRLWKLNVKAAFFASQAAARKMSAQEAGGVIVNVSSQMGHVGAPLRSVYCTTKHALEGLTKALALELAPNGIRVVSVAPTFVRTAMTTAQLDDPQIGPALLGKIPIGRFATEQDVAAAVVFAASDSAGAFTGSSLLIDGGWTAQ